METQLYSISKIFTEAIYRIPDYQRGYAWGRRQLKDFWSDVFQLEQGTNHYCGVLTLESTPIENQKLWEDDFWIISSKNYKPYYVVDGQQRLTTVIILIQAILETISEDAELNFDTIPEIRKKYIFTTKERGSSRSYLFGYEKDNPSYEYLKTTIFGEHSSSSYLNEETIYTINLSSAKEFFLNEIKEFSLPQLQSLFTKVTQHLLFNIYSIKDEIDVFVTFETMNNRGKPLSLLELLKNRLIYLSTKIKCDEEDKALLRRRINDTWKAVYHYLGKNKNKPLHDDVFLVAHYALHFYQVEDIDELHYQYKDDDIQRCEEELFNEIFTIRRVNAIDSPLTVDEINNYVESLQSSVRIWYDIHNPFESKNILEAEKYYVDKLNKLDFEEISPLLLLMYFKKTKRKSYIDYLQLLEKYFFVETLLPFGDDTIHLRGYRAISEILNNCYSLSAFFDNLKKQLDSLMSNPTFSEKITKRVSYIGFYGWNSIRYFLYEYEMHIKGKSKNNTSKINWDEFNAEKRDYITVEHVFPQKISDKSKDNYWKLRFKDLGIKQKRVLCDSLGNLLALSKPKNSSLQNFDFPTKVDSKEYVGYRYGSYSEIEVSKYPEWTPEAILKRGLKLTKFMESNWGFKFPNDAARIKFLRLDFLVDDGYVNI